MSMISFFVNGIPVPQGSKKAWLNKNTGRVMMVEDQRDRHADWRYHVTAVAQQARADHGLIEPLVGPVSVVLTFYFARLLGHYGTGGNAQVLKADAPDYPAKPPDIDKLMRAILDALTDARVWLDDSQVVSATVRKRWVDRFTPDAYTGVFIKIGDHE